MPGLDLAGVSVEMHRQGAQAAIAVDRIQATTQKAGPIP
jgi:hypothetical protein